MMRTVKRLSLQVSKNLGLFQLVRDSRWRRRRLLILCYHGISIEDEHEWNPRLYMRQSEFESRLEFLKREGYTVLPLNDAVERLYSNDLPERSVAITFDDGYYDFYNRAYPVLKAYGFPVTVYITTFRCGYNKPVFNLICSYLLWKRRGAVVKDFDFIGPDVTLDLRDAPGQKRALDALLKHSEREKLHPKRKEVVVERLAERLGIDYGEILAKRILHIMNPQEVAELSGAGVDFQLHTHLHRTPLDRGLFEKEIEDNRVRIQEMTNSYPVHFCYPSGNYNRAFLPWLAETNVVTATTCDPGIVSTGSNPWLLPRLVDSGFLTTLEFEGWLTGVASVMARQRKRGGKHAGNGNG